MIVRFAGLIAGKHMFFEQYPLLMKAPGMEVDMFVDELIDHTGILATILDFAGVPVHS